MCPAFGVFCPVYMCVFVCTFVEEVSVDLLAATTPFVAPRSKIGKLLMQIRLIRGHTAPESVKNVKSSRQILLKMLPWRLNACRKYSLF